MKKRTAVMTTGWARIEDAGEEMDGNKKGSSYKSIKKNIKIR